MKVFAGIRLTLWALALAVCLAVVGLYQSIAETALKPAVLQSWVTEAHVAQTIRDKVLTPRITDAIRASQPEGFALVPPELINKSLVEAVPADTLNQRLTPATTALATWLDSKSSELTYSIKSTDLRQAFFDRLDANIAAKQATLPDCNATNTYSDIQNGICAYSDQTSERIRAETVQTAKESSLDLFGETITQTSVPLVPTASTSIDPPEILNILNATSLLASAVVILGALWLIVRKHTAGMVALGLSGVLGGSALLIITRMLADRISNSTADTLYQPLLKVAGEGIAHKSLVYALMMIMIGLGLIAIGIALRFLLKRHRRTTESVHFSSDDATT